MSKPVYVINRQNYNLNKFLKHNKIDKEEQTKGI